MLSLLSQADMLPSKGFNINTVLINIAYKSKQAKAKQVIGDMTCGIIIVFSLSNSFLIFTDSAHWAGSVIESQCPSVCVFVCVSVKKVVIVN